LDRSPCASGGFAVFADRAQAAEIALHQALMPEIAPSGHALAFAHGRQASGWLHCKQESIRLTATEPRHAPEPALPESFDALLGSRLRLETPQIAG
jgi:hypothetical protein